MTPEGKVKAEIKAYLDSIGAYYFMPVQMGYGAKTLDFLCCVPMIITPQMVGQRWGIFAGVEAKREGTAATNFQTQTILTIHQAAGIAGVAHSGDEAKALICI